MTVSASDLAKPERVLYKSAVGYEDYLNADGTHTLKLFPGMLKDKAGVRKPFTDVTNLMQQGQNLQLTWYSHEVGRTKSLVLDPYIII